MSTASSADESDASRYSLSYVSKKRKNAEVEQLRLSSSLSSSYDLAVSDTSTNMVSNVNTDTINVETDTEMDTNTEKEANKEEKEWWARKGSLGSLDINEERLPLVLARNVTFSRFAKRVEIIKARRFLDYRNGTVTIIELPTKIHEAANTKLSQAFGNATQDLVDSWGAAELYTDLQTCEYEEPDACFIPRRLLENPTPNPCDFDGNPWPTIIFEVASSETLQHVKDKINDYWLKSNRCEDVIVIKIGSWKGRRRNNQTRRPLRRLWCLKFCRAATLQQNPNATTFDPIEEIEFGSVHANGKESDFCTGPHMKWITINCNCIFTGCSQPPPLPLFHAVISSRPFPQPQVPPQPQGPLQPQVPYPLQVPGVAIDLYDIQQAIFRAMGLN